MFSAQLLAAGRKSEAFYQRLKTERVLGSFFISELVPSTGAILPHRRCWPENVDVPFLFSVRLGTSCRALTALLPLAGWDEQDKPLSVAFQSVYTVRNQTNSFASVTSIECFSAIKPQDKNLFFFFPES